MSLANPISTTKSLESANYDHEPPRPAVDAVEIAVSILPSGKAIIKHRESRPNPVRKFVRTASASELSAVWERLPSCVRQEPSAAQTRTKLQI